MGTNDAFLKLLRETSLTVPGLKYNDINPFCRREIITGSAPSWEALPELTLQRCEYCGMKIERCGCGAQ